MRKRLKTFIRHSFILPKVYDLLICKWWLCGKPLPPPHALKQSIVKHYATMFSIDTLIETGTHHGAMIWATHRYFRKIYSIELDNNLYQNAVEQCAPLSNVKLIHGDSAQVLATLLPEIQVPCVFWLDAHYSGPGTAGDDYSCPVVEELRTIFQHGLQQHVVLVDDARFFNGSNGYPTIDEVRSMIAEFDSQQLVQVENDIIRIHHN